MSRQMRFLNSVIVMGLVLVLGACVSHTVTPTPHPTTTPVPLSGASIPAESGYVEGFNAANEPFRGNPQAQVVVEEFSSYGCSFCRRYFQETYPDLMDDYVKAGRVLYIFRDYPLGTETLDFQAAEAAACAAQVGGAAAYWQMHERLFSEQDVWADLDEAAGRVQFREYAEALGLAVQPFETCMVTHATRDEINADGMEGAERGVTGTPTFFINGEMLVGAQPYGVFARIFDARLVGASATFTELVGTYPTPTPVAIASGESWLTLGDAAAPVVMVEFADYQCTYCARYYTETWPMVRTHLIESGRVRYVFKDFPLTGIHPQALAAHEAARCAGEQGQYWEMHAQLFTRQAEWAVDTPTPVFEKLAAGLRLDGSAFKTCLESARWRDAVLKDMEEGIGFGIQGTPAFYINGYPVYGAQAYEVFEYAVGLAEEGTLGDAYRPE